MVVLVDIRKNQQVPLPILGDPETEKFSILFLRVKGAIFRILQVRTIISMGRYSKILGPKSYQPALELGTVLEYQVPGTSTGPGRARTGR